jgi:hypothetical protein
VSLKKANLIVDIKKMLFLLSLFSICEAFEEIERVALKPPQSTKEMIELGEYMLHVKNKKMIQLSVRKIMLLPI